MRPFLIAFLFVAISWAMVFNRSTDTDTVEGHSPRADDKVMLEGKMHPPPVNFPVNRFQTQPYPFNIFRLSNVLLISGFPASNAIDLTAIKYLHTVKQAVLNPNAAQPVMESSGRRNFNAFFAERFPTLNFGMQCSNRNEKLLNNDDRTGETIDRRDGLLRAS